ncbi:hypothetical protein BVY04_03355 [bacterium M21]|nr:hypothetical protein BVY04_03355 [bacterium M21]
MHTFVLIACLTGIAHAAVEFPGEKPGKANSEIGAEYTLSNQVISASWKVLKGKLYLHSMKNRLSNKSYMQDNSPAFDIKTSGSNEFIDDWKLVKSAVISDAPVDKKSGSIGKHYSGKVITAIFSSAKTGVTAKWQGELRDDAGYIRTTVELISTDGSLRKITHIQLFSHAQVSKPVANAKLAGAPVLAEQMFFGVEVPFFKSDIRNGKFSSGFSCKLNVSKEVNYSFSSVIGTFPKGQLRRSMLHYIERERVRSYSQFLHYNCWFDLCRNVSETGMLDRIDLITEELGEKRDVFLDSYVVDDGYDDWANGFWTFNKEKFPKGFVPLAKRLKEVNSSLGIWLSPAGGYGGSSRERKKRAAEIGIKSFDLSTPIYYDWFLERHQRFINDEQAGYFKWDKLGGGVSGHFMALMDIAHKLRKINPKLFINTTVGTWQSPFWLQHVDCTWRGKQDMGFIGDGDEREKWLTYRDGVSYNVIKGSQFLYPLNALMNHGIVFSDGHQFASKALKGTRDMRNEVRSYFGGGYALQELYLNPHIMKKEQWDAIAEAALWAKKQASVLVDAHFIGGNPNNLEVYGFAAWQKNKGTITLRNPKNAAQTFQLDVANVFELPQGAVLNYKLLSPYKDQRIPKLQAKAGTPVSVELKPFEVLVFDASAGK